MDQPTEYVPTVDDVQGAISSAERFFEAVSSTQAEETRLADALAPLHTSGPHDPQTVEAAFRAYAAVAAEVAQRMHEQVAALYAPVLDTFPEFFLWDFDRRGGPPEPQRQCRLFVRTGTVRGWLEPGVGIYEAERSIPGGSRQTPTEGTVRFIASARQGKLFATARVADGQNSDEWCGLGIFFRPIRAGRVRLRPYLTFFRTGVADAPISSIPGLTTILRTENTMSLILDCDRQQPNGTWTFEGRSVAWSRTTGVNTAGTNYLTEPLTQLTPELSVVTQPGALYVFWVKLAMRTTSQVAPSTGNTTSCSADAECAVSVIHVCED
jgi:hypothetical protein